MLLKPGIQRADTTERSTVAAGSWRPSASYKSPQLLSVSHFLSVRSIADPISMLARRRSDLFLQRAYPLYSLGVDPLPVSTGSFGWPIFSVAPTEKSL